VDVRQLLQEGYFGGDPTDILTAELRKDDQGVVSPRVVGYDQQRAPSRDILRAARRYVTAPVCQSPLAGFGKADFGDLPIKVQAYGRQANERDAEQDPEQAAEQPSPGQTEARDKVGYKGFG
jgi:hypothetical protein